MNKNEVVDKFDVEDFISRAKSYLDKFDIETDFFDTFDHEYFAECLWDIYACENAGVKADVDFEIESSESFLQFEKFITYLLVGKLITIGDISFDKMIVYHHIRLTKKGKGLCKYALDDMTEVEMLESALEHQKTKTLEAMVRGNRMLCEAVDHFNKNS